MYQDINHTQLFALDIGAVFESYRAQTNNFFGI